MDFNSTNIEDWKKFCLWQMNLNHSLAQMCGELIDELMRYMNAEEIERGLEELLKGGGKYDGERN